MPHQTSNAPQLILASSSPYRKALLERAGFQPACKSPEIDETPLLNEPPRECALRLSTLKARAIAANNDLRIVIGSDQVAALGSVKLGKPGNFEQAHLQLKAQSGQKVIFFTGVCVKLGETELSTVVSTSVHFRELSDKEINHYLERERPFDCAGSFKSEGLGINLFKSIDSTDPSALVGLPLIKTAEFLREFGLNPLFD